jgi:hypothetical protein
LRRASDRPAIKLGLGAVAIMATARCLSYQNSVSQDK